MTAKYKRVVIKISGEALAGPSGTGIDNHIVNKVVQQIKVVHDLGIDVGIIIGGGNFWRGRQGVDMDRTTADHMGMLATVINSLALQDALEHSGVPTRVQTALTIERVAEPYILRKALRHLEKGRVVIFACGTGNPYFSTDSAAALRASEIGADALLKATKVDGIYTADPKKDPKAKKYGSLKYETALEKRLKVMDSAAFALCMDNDIPIVVFDFFDGDALERVVCGEAVGTLVS